VLLRSVVLSFAALLLTAIPASAAVNSVSVGDNYFRAAVKTVSPGTRIVWVNRGNRYHTVTTRGWSVVLRPGERYSRRIRHGFRYVCAYHGSMAGRVVVR
jgi:plastocyanin